MSVISVILLNFAWNNGHDHPMNSKKQIIFPKCQSLLEQMGKQIKLVRKRRKLSTVRIAERAAIARSTLYLVEKRDPRVSFGAYFNVLRVLGLHSEVLKLAGDDEFGRKFRI